MFLLPQTELFTLPCSTILQPSLQMQINSVLKHLLRKGGVNAACMAMDGWCTFFHRERERDCFEQSLFRSNINAR